MNQKVFDSVVAIYGLDPNEVEILRRLVALHHDGSSSEADVAFDLLLDSLEEDSRVLQALGKYQKNSVETPPKLKVLLSVLQIVVVELIKIVKKESDRTFRGVLEMGIKDFFLVVIAGTKYGSKLYLRLLHTEVGYLSGYVSDIDRLISRDKGLATLSRFEKWLMQELIEREKTLRRQAFRQSCIDYLGEDSEADWCMI